MWSKENLTDFIDAQLSGHRLILVSNREPYRHQYVGGSIEWEQPASGVTAALDPIMRTCGGTWIAHGSGDADAEVVDINNRIGVPPGDPRFTLRRLWLTREEEMGYYYGLANQALWPLCHEHQELEDQIESVSDEINWSWANRSWRPIHLLKRQFSQARLMSLYRLADCCVVSSLHDGMNLVAKEFVSSRVDEDGVLVLSDFPGASRELVDHQSIRRSSTRRMFTDSSENDSRRTPPANAENACGCFRQQYLPMDRKDLIRAAEA